MSSVIPCDENVACLQNISTRAEESPLVNNNRLVTVKDRRQPFNKYWKDRNDLSGKSENLFINTA
jgi:hypothetical protein